jgi:LmbE family N-acetylglucosaminyl deacetylase
MLRKSDGFIHVRLLRSVVMTLFVVTVGIAAAVHEPRLTGNPSFSGDVVAFYPEHPDDEVLWGGSAIRSAVDTKGASNVYVVLVTRGLGATPFTRTAEYASLTSGQKGQLRENELRAAAKELGVQSSNIIVLKDPGPGVDDSLVQMRDTALRIERTAESEGKTVTHVAHSYKYDDNAEHRGNGRVIKTLLDEGQIHDALFWFKPQYRFRIPPADVVKFQALAPSDEKAVHRAIDRYETTDARVGLEAVGYRATPWYFTILGWDKYLTSALHTAAVPG